MPRPERRASPNRVASGQQAEQLACRYLQKSGLKLLASNYHSRYGEIDLIMQDRNKLVFVEVRFRKSNDRMHATETIDRNKCERIIKTALDYLQKVKQNEMNQCRFDVVTITPEQNTLSINWIPDAFQA